MRLGRRCRLWWFLGVAWVALLAVQPAVRADLNPCACSGHCLSCPGDDPNDQVQPNWCEPPKAKACTTEGCQGAGCTCASYCKRGGPPCAGATDCATFGCQIPPCDCGQRCEASDPPCEQ